MKSLGNPVPWIILGGIALLGLVALQPAPAPEAQPAPPQEATARMQEELKVMREWALKSNGDFDKVPKEVQGYMNQTSMGHGREWLRQEAERLKKSTQSKPK